MKNLRPYAIVIVLCVGVIFFGAWIVKSAKGLEVKSLDNVNEATPTVIVNVREFNAQNEKFGPGSLIRLESNGLTAAGPILVYRNEGVIVLNWKNVSFDPRSGKDLCDGIDTFAWFSPDTLMVEIDRIEIGQSVRSCTRMGSMFDIKISDSGIEWMEMPYGGNQLIKKTYSLGSNRSTEEVFWEFENPNVYAIKIDGVNESGAIAIFEFDKPFEEDANIVAVWIGRLVGLEELELVRVVGFPDAINLEKDSFKNFFLKQQLDELILGVRHNEQDAVFDWSSSSWVWAPMDTTLEFGLVGTFWNKPWINGMPIQSEEIKLSNDRTAILFEGTSGAAYAIVSYWTEVVREANFLRFSSVKERAATLGLSQ